MPISQRILILLLSYISLGKDLANAGYNQNTKKKEKIVYKECCVWDMPMDGIIFSLKQLSCSHPFHTKGILEWFENLPNNLDLNCPMCRQMELFQKVINTVLTEDVEKNNYNNNNL